LSACLKAALCVCSRDDRCIPGIRRVPLMLFAVIRLAVALSLILATLTAVDSAALKRRALVIANAEYVHTTTLKNPSNDAALIDRKLRELGFEVQLERDLDARRFSEIIQDFAASLDKESEVLFYYAGHGLQFRGENFLVGVDARLRGEATLQFETFKLNTVINLLERQAGTTLLFWDACRDNPLADELLRSIAPSALSAPSEAVRGGAAALPPRIGDTLIVFSAAPGKKALDGGGDLSPFAESLGRHIASPNVEIESMLKQVTAEVLERTQQFQRPERLSQLTRDFYFHREGQAEVAAQEEIKRLRAQLAELKREPIAPKRFTILGSDDPALGKSIITKPNGATTNPQNSRTRGHEAAPPAKETLPLREAEIVSTDVAPVDPVDRNVVIAVNRTASTVVRKLGVSPNGTLLALGDEEGLVRIVRLGTLEVIATIRAHSARVSDLDFSPDNRTLLSAGRDGAIRFWDVESGHQLRELKVPGSIPYSARMHPNFPDRYALMGDREGRLVAWDLKRDRIITNAKFHHGPVLSVAYQPAGGGTFLSGGGDGRLKIRLPAGRRISVRSHNGAMFRASYSATGKLVYTVGADRMAKIWDAARLEQQHPQATTIMQGHLKYVLAADMSLDEKVLVTGGADKAMNLWNVGSGRLVSRMQGHTSDVEAVVFSPNGKFVVSASEDKSVRIWSVENQEELARLFFQKNGEKYAGVTFDNRAFGDRNSGLVSVYVDGRELFGSDADRIVKYIGRGIVIIENEN
jgi:Caspase domain/WD domain, G-beta repeat/Anaphase-promoting complex subunit 4 WD40 domain